MARTLNGNLTGRAASQELRDVRNQLFEDSIRDSKRYGVEFDHALQTLDYLMEESEFISWWDTFSPTMTKRDFLPIMEAKISDIIGSGGFYAHGDITATERADEFTEADERERQDMHTLGLGG